MPPATRKTINGTLPLAHKRGSHGAKAYMSAESGDAQQRDEVRPRHLHRLQPVRLRVSHQCDDAPPRRSKSLRLCSIQRNVGFAGRASKNAHVRGLSSFRTPCYADIGKLEAQGNGRILPPGNEESTTA